MLKYLPKRKSAIQPIKDCFEEISRDENATLVAQAAGLLFRRLPVGAMLNSPDTQDGFYGATKNLRHSFFTALPAQIFFSLRDRPINSF